LFGDGEGASVSAASNIDFLAALGEEFCWALSPPVPGDLIVPQDGYEVWLQAFGDHPTPAALAALTDSGEEQLCAAAVAYFECPELSTAQLRLAVSRTLARWPV
jgi:hypothetical protein